MANKVSYDPNTDYTALRDQAAANNDYEAAAKYEAQRNQKIADLNASGTNKWNAQVEHKYSQPQSTTAATSGNTAASGGASTASGPYDKPYTAESAKGYIPVDVKGSEYYAAREGMSDTDKAALEQAGVDYNRYKDAGDTDGMAAAHAQAEAIRGKYGYSGGGDGSQRIKTEEISTGTAGEEVPLLTNRAPDLSGLMENWFTSAQAQQENQIDYSVNQGVTELQRAEEDAQLQFQTQQNQIDADEAKALDNQALYAEARGDRGGIGQAQYGQIQATAMTNRRTVNSARTKLATDTARQIADLRAQGEFQKADALLDLTQTYLSQLIELQKWGAEFNLDVDKFNAQIQMWQAEFDQSVGEMLGEYQGTPTLENVKFQASLQQSQQELLADSGFAALSVGVRPTQEQQAAMGYTDAQINAELAVYQQKQSSKSSSSKSSSGKGSGSDKADDKEEEEEKGVSTLRQLYKQMYAAGIRDYASAKFYLRNQGYTVSDSEDYADDYYIKYESGEFEPEWLEDSANREQLYDLLGDSAKQMLSAIQRGNYRTGAEGLNSSSKQKLEQAVTSGQINEGELDIILDLLGVS